jgi:precorrin-6B methylase 2
MPQPTIAKAACKQSRSRGLFARPSVTLLCLVPYRIDLRDPPDGAFDRLVALGALDVELAADGLAALLPDGVEVARVTQALGVDSVLVSSAEGRDDGSVWALSRRRFRVRRLLVEPAHLPASPGALRLTDGPAFGTGRHPTTVLCLEALEEILKVDCPARVLDVGTGSGVLALAALLGGVPQAVGLDIDANALRVAAENARLNALTRRLHLVNGGPEAVQAAWPLVFANVLPAPLMEIAPVLVRRVGHGGRLVLSGIPSSLALEVEQVYRRLGMRQVHSETRTGWTALVLQPSW